MVKEVQTKPHRDNEFILALKLRAVNPWIPAAEVAEELGETERNTRIRLLKLEVDKKVEVKKHGNTWYFRPIQ